jgi:hypothetical protein
MKSASLPGDKDPNEGNIPRVLAPEAVAACITYILRKGKKKGKGYRINQ